MILTTTIGAYPKPDFLDLPDWFKDKKGTDAEYPTSKWEQAKLKMGEEYEVQIKHASESIIKDQIECGIDIITDGEVRRENYIHYHCRHLSGIDFEKLTKKTARTGNYDCWLPTITNKVEFNGSFLNKEYEFNQSISKNPIKVTIPGPLTITDTIADEFYNDHKMLGVDLGEAINKDCLLYTSPSPRD